MSLFLVRYQPLVLVMLAVVFGIETYVLSVTGPHVHSLMPVLMLFSVHLLVSMYYLFAIAPEVEPGTEATMAKKAKWWIIAYLVSAAVWLLGTYLMT